MLAANNWLKKYTTPLPGKLKQISSSFLPIKEKEGPPAATALAPEYIVWVVWARKIQLLFSNCNTT